MRISDWSSDVCSSDLDQAVALRRQREAGRAEFPVEPVENRRGIGGAVEINRHRAALIALGVDRHVGDLRSGIEMRSEERRGGKECVRTCRSRWSRYH